MSKKSVFGLSENVAGCLSYVFSFFSGIVVLIMEKENKFVRFHALQSTVWFSALGILEWVLGVLCGIPLLGFLFGTLSWFVGIVIFVSWIYLMYKAINGHAFKIPVLGLGETVWNQINK